MVGLIGLYLMSARPLIARALSVVTGIKVEDTHKKEDLKSGWYQPTPTYKPTVEITPTIVLQAISQPTQENTPIPTLEPTQEPTIIILPTSTPTPNPNVYQGWASFYWPAWGGENCNNLVEPVDCEHLANGDLWYSWVGRGLACPFEIPLGSVLLINGDRWTCVDRGTRVLTRGDRLYTIEFLNEGLPYGFDFGSVFDFELIYNPNTPNTLTQQQ